MDLEGIRFEGSSITLNRPPEIHQTRYYFVAAVVGDESRFALRHTYIKFTPSNENPTAEFIAQAAVGLLAQLGKNAGILSYQEVSQAAYEFNTKDLVASGPVLHKRCDSCGHIDKTGERVYCEKCMRAL